MATRIPYTPLPLSQDDVVYDYGPDSAPSPGVAPGEIEQLRITESAVFPGTSRTVWIHRPARHAADAESAVMVFNDGWWYLDPDGDVRAGIVLDSLAAGGDLPPMIGVFVDPGVREVDGVPVKNRNAEYDAFDDRYATFLLDEVLPLVERRYPVSADPRMRGICGGSSGGNAAMTALWMRPDGFGRAVMFNASFAQMPGGNPYPALIAETPTRDVRLFLQAAHRDLGWNAKDHNWFAENLETAAALARGGYDVRLVVGDGGHSPNHGGVLLPDALRWVWRSGDRVEQD